MTFLTRRRRQAALILAMSLLISANAAGSEDVAKRIEALTDTYYQLGMFNGSVLVAANGEAVFSGGFGLADIEWEIPNTPDTKFRLGSITKQFTAMLVLQLVAEGELSLDATVSSILPTYRSDTGSRITVHQLLSHTSGLSSPHKPPSPSDVPGRTTATMAEYVANFCSGDLYFEPGSQYRYSNSGYRLLGAILERVSGKTYEEMLEERIFGPLAMEDSGYDHSEDIIERRASGYFKTLHGYQQAKTVDMSIPFSAGALYSTVEDLARWDRALSDDTLLPADLRAKLFEPVLSNYGYGWTIQRRPVASDGSDRTVVSHSGGINGFHATILRVLEDGFLVVLLNNTSQGRLRDLRDGILDVLYGREPVQPKPPVLGELVATYQSGDAESALARYHDLKINHPEGFEYDVNQLNEFCYWLMDLGDHDGAIAACTLNVEVFPQSANAYDSLGEALMTAGISDRAVWSYARSLELDPGNTNAVRQLMKLTGVGD